MLCPIGLDHPQLGSTVVEVTGEKAGIIKQGKVAVVREQEDEALEVIRQRCEEQIATLLLEGRDWELADLTPAVGGRPSRSGVCTRRTRTSSCRSTGSTRRTARPRRSSPCEALLERPLDRDAVRLALGAATSPGRLEVAARRPLVILDGAHNPAAARALAEALPDTFTWDRLHLVMGVFADKDLDGIVRPLAPLADVGYAAADRERSGPATARGGGRDDRAGHPHRDLHHRSRRVGRGGERRVGRRPHPGDGLSVHCRGRSSGSVRRTPEMAPGSQVESTLLIVKPDGVRRGLVGEVLRRVEAKGLAIAEISSLTIDRALAEEHYGEHRDKPFFGELVGFITSGPVVVARLEGRGAIDVWRTMMGPTDPATAPPGTIRGDTG